MQTATAANNPPARPIFPGLYEAAAAWMRQQKPENIGICKLQRHLGAAYPGISYHRAATLFNLLREDGVIVGEHGNYAATPENVPTLGQRRFNIGDRVRFALSIRQAKALLAAGSATTPTLHISQLPLLEERGRITRLSNGVAVVRFDNGTAAALSPDWLATENTPTDSERLDWLAGRDNAISRLSLPAECLVCAHHGMRAALDMAMQIQKEQEQEE